IRDIALGLVGDEKTALLAVAVAGLSLSQIFYALWPGPDLYFTLLFLAGFGRLLRRTPSSLFSSATLFGFSSLFRPVFALLYPVYGLASLWRPPLSWEFSWKRRLASFALFYLLVNFPCYALATYRYFDGGQFFISTYPKFVIAANVEKSVNNDPQAKADL